MHGDGDRLTAPSERGSTSQVRLLLGRQTEKAALQELLDALHRDGSATLLRREGRRQDARIQLHRSLDIFDSICAPAFADRTRRELAATGETPRKRTDESRSDLTAQEAHIASLAREGLTNPEIGGQLFISPRTVEWHLRHIYGKLGIASRKELRTVEIHFT